MASFFQDLLNSRFIKPAVDEGVEKALRGKQPVTYDASVTPELSLSRAIGQPHDAKYVLLYSLYKLNTDVSGCVHKLAGGVTGAGWRITTMDPQAQLTDSLKAQIQEIGRWLRNPNPNRLYESVLYEGVQHWGLLATSTGMSRGQTRPTPGDKADAPCPNQGQDQHSR